MSENVPTTPTEEQLQYFVKQYGGDAHVMIPAAQIAFLDTATKGQLDYVFNAAFQHITTGEEKPIAVPRYVQDDLITICTPAGDEETLKFAGNELMRASIFRETASLVGSFKYLELLANTYDTLPEESKPKTENATLDYWTLFDSYRDGVYFTLMQSFKQGKGFETGARLLQAFSMIDYY